MTVSHIALFNDLDSIEEYRSGVIIIECLSEEFGSCFFLMMKVVGYGLGG